MRKHLLIALAAAAMAMSAITASSAFAGAPPLPPDVSTPVEFGQISSDAQSPLQPDQTSPSTSSQASQSATKGKPLLLLAVGPNCSICNTVQALITQEAQKYPDIDIQLVRASSRMPIPASALPAAIVIVPDVGTDPVFVGKVDVQTAAQADAFLDKR